jgi:hypothetical protein
MTRIFITQTIVPYSEVKIIHMKKKIWKFGERCLGNAVGTPKRCFLESH